MLKFKYSFQRVLDIRAKEKERAQAQVAEALRKLEKAERNVAQVYTQLEEEESKFWANQEVSITVSELRSRQAYIHHLRQKVHLEEEAMHMASKQVHKKQDVLEEKVREEKKWSTHKERLALEFVEEMKKQEQLQLDELSTQRYFRQLAARSE